MGTLKREVDRKDQSRDRKVQLNSLMNQMQEQGLVPTAPRDPNEFLARAAQKDKDSAAMEQMHQQLNPEIVPTKMKPPVPEYAGIPRPNGGTTMGEGHMSAPSAAQRNIGRANEAIANATTPRTGNEVPVENQVAPEDALLAETQSNNPAQAAIDNIQSAREGRDTGQPQGADAPFDPKRQAEPDEIEERQNELLDEQLQTTLKVTSGPKTYADQAILAQDAQNNGVASQFTESTTDKYVREMRANENVRFADVARRYADDVKKSPWYKDNRLWGAVLGFGMARLAGADPRMGMMMAGMTAGVINKDNVDYLRAAKLRNEDDWDKHDEYLQNLSETAYNAKMEQQNYDRDLGDRRADLADTRKYNQGVTSAKNRFTSEQNQLDRDSRAADRAESRAVRDEDRQWKRGMEQRSTNQGLRDDIDTIDYDTRELHVAKDKVAKIRAALKGNVVGPVASRVERMQGGFSEEHPQYRDVEQFVNLKGVDLTSKLKGAISDKDLVKLEKTLPKMTDDEAVWETWLTSLDEAIDRELAGKTKQRTKYKGRMVGDSKSSSGGSLPEGVTVTRIGD